MNHEPIRDIGQIVVCLSILAIAGYIQITQGQISAPWDTLLLAVVAVLGLGDGVRLIIRHVNNKSNRNAEQERRTNGNRNHH